MLRGLIILVILISFLSASGFYWFQKVQKIQQSSEDTLLSHGNKIGNNIVYGSTNVEGIAVEYQVEDDKYKLNVGDTKLVQEILASKNLYLKPISVASLNDNVEIPQLKKIIFLFTEEEQKSFLWKTTGVEVPNSSVGFSGEGDTLIVKLFINPALIEDKNSTVASFAATFSLLEAAKALPDSGGVLQATEQENREIVESTYQQVDNLPTNEYPVWIN